MDNENQIYKVISQRLKAARENFNEEHNEQITQEYMAKKLGLTKPTVNKYENGGTFPPVHVLLKYAEKFHVSMDYLCGRCAATDAKNYPISRELGLTDEAIETLKYINNKSDDFNDYKTIISSFIGNRKETYNLLVHLFILAKAQYMGGYANPEQLLDVMTTDIKDYIEKFVITPIFSIFQQHSDIFDKKINDIQFKQIEKNLVKMYFGMKPD